MAYGKIKADTLVYDNSGSDVETSISSLAAKAPLPASAGTVAASEVVQVDANKDTTGIRNLTISGNLQVNGTTTTVASSTMTVTDKNIEIAKGAANDAAADGAGITIDSGDGDKTWNWVDATDAWTSSEHIHLLDNKYLKVGTASDLSVFSNGTTNYIRTDTSHILNIDRTGGDKMALFNPGAQVELYHNNVKKIETTAAGVTVTGTVSDSKGNLRSIPANSPGSNHVATAADAGKCIYIAYDVTINPSVFAAGDAVTIVNNSANDETIIEGTNFTLYNSADGTSGNDLTLAKRGMATIWFAAHNIGYISGAGLS